MSDITLKDAFELYLKYRDQILTMWNFFSVVTLGVVVWALGGEKCAAVLGSAGWIAGGYTAFAIANAVAVILSQRELIRCASGLAQMAQGYPNASVFVPTPFSAREFLGFYAVIILIVDAAILKAANLA